MLYFDQILQVLSISAITTTIALFFCGIPICLTIKRQNAIGDISGVPFLMGLLGGSFWLRYGFLKMDWTMIIVNLVGVTFFTLYCLFFLYFSWPKKSFVAQFGLVISMISSMIVWISIKPDLDLLGVICMTFNIMNFGAPLAGLGIVLKTRNVSSLPLPMCVANFLVSSQWCLYGNLVQDLYVVVPNGIGMVLAVVQLSLFIILPMQENGMSPLEKLAGWFTGRNNGDCTVVKDLEKAEESSSSTSSTRKSPHSDDTTASLHTRFQRLIGGDAATESRRCSFDLLSHPPSYKSRSSSVPDISSLQSF